MELGCSHVLISASDLKKSYEFYVEKLGLPVIEEHPKMFAFRAGEVRFSVFGGGQALDPAKDAANVSIVLRTDDVERAVRELKAKGAAFLGEVVEAKGFMKHAELEDPDRNLLYLAQYLSDPLAAHPS
jgi:catechol 2,3-dioxygenase-like lactoylglutathione lyase family enzyme